MSTKVAPSGPGPMNAMHTAGIFSDMTVDGPEIGTLIVIVDRAKNLPNRKTMGKQNPYCAARLGKDAKKTETDKRGGQTPRWDQELRFTVHDSPDYRNLKVSVFNDDKKTDLIGETWVGLDNVVIQGGGRNDTWHSLNYKSKYAGEIMLELTYYDSRPKAESKRRESLVSAQDGQYQDRKLQTPIKRRPLPNDPAGGATPSPTVTPDIARAAGPRTMGPRSRDSSVPFDANSPHTRPSAAYPPSPAPPVQHPQQDEFDYHPGFQASPSMQPDYLPQLPPSSRSRGGMRPQTTAGNPNAYHGKPPTHPELMHSHSAPSGVLTEQQYQDPYTARGPPPSSRQRYTEQPAWEGSQTGGHPRFTMQPTVEDETDILPPLPPLPPSHRNSAPAVPRQGQGQYISSQSPLQSVERQYASPRGPPTRGRSVDDYSDAPLPYGNAQPDFRKSYSGPPQHQAYPPSPQQRPSPNQRLAGRHSVAEPFYDTITPPRAHPLAQEMRRSASPNPYHVSDPAFDEPQHQAYYNREIAPIIRPRPVSPQPPRKSLASIQHPVSTFASKHASTPDLRNSRSSPTRRSVSPIPSPIEPQSRSGMPFSPDSFDSYNPNSHRSSFAANANPYSPYHIPAGPKSAPPPEAESPRPLPNPNDPIVGWDGRTIDPSDHLPVHSWAPEPEKKTPTKTYGGAESTGPRGLSGPRTTPASSVAGGGGRRDVIVNVRTKHSATFSDPASPNPGGRNRLVKRNGNPSSPNPSQQSEGFPPLSEIEVPNPYAGGNEYAGFNGGDGRHDYAMQRFQNPSPGSSASRGGDRHYGDIFGGGGRGGYDERSRYDSGGGGYENDGYGAGYGGAQGYGNAPPDLPPKVPLAGYDQHGYGDSALSREMARIQIGGGSRSRSGTPGAPSLGATARRSRYG